MEGTLTIENFLANPINAMEQLSAFEETASLSARDLTEILQDVQESQDTLDWFCMQVPAWFSMEGVIKFLPTAAQCSLTTGRRIIIDVASYASLLAGFNARLHDKEAKEPVPYTDNPKMKIRMEANRLIEDGLPDVAARFLYPEPDYLLSALTGAGFYWGAGGFTQEIFCERTTSWFREHEKARTVHAQSVISKAVEGYINRSFDAMEFFAFTKEKAKQIFGSSLASDAHISNEPTGLLQDMALNRLAALYVISLNASIAQEISIKCTAKESARESLASRIARVSQK